MALAHSIGSGFMSLLRGEGSLCLAALAANALAVMTALASVALALFVMALAYDSTYRLWLFFWLWILFSGSSIGSGF